MPAPQVGASAAILVDGTTGAVLWAHNPHQRRPIASTTKILTALLVIEKGHLDDLVTVSPRAAETPQSGIELRPGERLRVRELLTALLVKSANDAAVALAEHESGSVEDFAALMNQRAWQLGARDSHFANPNGLYHRQHYSSAYDLALIAREAMRHPLFRTLVATRRAQIPWEGKPWNRLLESKNKLLTTFPGGDGIKTGYVKQSGHCLVGSATRGGWRLIGVLLDSPDLWADARTLLEWGFANFEPLVYAREAAVAGRVPVHGGSAAMLPVTAGGTLQEVVPRGERPHLQMRCELTRNWAPYRRGQRVGRLVLYRDGQARRAVPAYAGQDMGRAWWAWAWLVLKWLVISMAGLLALLVGVRTGVKAAKTARKGRHRRQAGGRAPYP